MATLIEQSRKSWNASGDSATLEQINAGSLQRIAAATETMAQRYNDLIRERDMYRNMYERSVARVGHLSRSNISLRGQITKLRKAIAAQQSGQGAGSQS